MRLHLQYFGGRGSGSGMTAGSSSSAPMSEEDRAREERRSLRIEFNRLDDERKEVARTRPSSDEERRQLRDRFNDLSKRETEVSFSLIEGMSDERIQRMADKYIESYANNWTDSAKEKRRRLNVLAGTKKDGTPTKSAIEDARRFVSSAVNDAFKLYSDPYVGANDRGQTDRVGLAIAQAARRYKDRS